MVQIKITKLMFKGAVVPVEVGKDRVTLMCLLDNGWVMMEEDAGFDDEDSTTTFYPSNSIEWVEGAI